MKKVDATVKKETYYIFFFSVILSMLMQSVFLVASKWDYTILLGNILGVLASVGNFFLMGLTVQNALEKDADDAKKLIKASQQLRLFGMLIIALIGYLIPIFNIYAIVLPYLFPRIAIMFKRNQN